MICIANWVADRLAAMPDDTRTVPITLDLEPTAASVLGDATRRASVGRIVSRMLRPASADRLLALMDTISAEARESGLTEEILEAELAAYNAEGRERPPAV